MPGCCRGTRPETGRRETTIGWPTHSAGGTGPVRRVIGPFPHWVAGVRYNRRPAPRSKQADGRESAVTPGRGPSETPEAACTSGGPGGRDGSRWRSGGSGGPWQASTWHHPSLCCRDAHWSPVLVCGRPWPAPAAAETALECRKGPTGRFPRGPASFSDFPEFGAQCGRNQPRQRRRKKVQAKCRRVTLRVEMRRTSAICAIMGRSSRSSRFTIAEIRVERALAGSDVMAMAFLCRACG